MVPEGELACTKTEYVRTMYSEDSMDALVVIAIARIRTATPADGIDVRRRCFMFGRLSVRTWLVLTP